MFTYNSYNENLYVKIINFYNTYNETNKNKQIELLNLAYDILYQENIFISISNDIKFSFLTFIKLLKKQYWDINFYSYSKEIQHIILLLEITLKEINSLNLYKINPITKNKIENILKINNYITDIDIKNHQNVFNLILDNNGQFDINKIKEFFISYNIDLSSSTLNIKNIKIPNFLLLNNCKNFEIEYEFLHLLFKIYGPYLYYGHIFQEGYEYKINSSDVVFDCGSNMGLFALYCAAQGAQVYCFEPLSYIRKFLNISKNFYPNNLHIIPYGLSNKEKETFFMQTSNPGASNNINNSCNKSLPLYKEKSKLLSIDAFCKETSIIPTFIKIDVEGSENEVLLGSKNIIKTYKPIIHIALNHLFNDSYTLIPQIQNYNSNYNFFNFIEGNIQSNYVLCK